MSGIKGAKQKQTLSIQQISMIKEYSLEIKEAQRSRKLCLSYQDLEKLEKLFNLSFEAIQRRWSVSQPNASKLVVCYPWDFRFNEKIPFKSFIYYECEFCLEKSIIKRKKLLNRKIKNFRSCGDCHARRVAGLPEQRKINSSAQLIAQNNPETRDKMSKSIKTAWKRDYEKRCISIRDSYDKNPEYKEKIRNASLRNWEKEEYRKKIEKSNAYCWGNYSGIFYQSLCELAFILWCVDQKIDIRRYDMKHIDYTDSSGNTRTYIPDFIINSKTIIEVKSSLEREKNLGRLEQVSLKALAASELCKSTGYGYRIVEIRKDVPSSFYRKAGKIHHGENKKEDFFSSQGESSRFDD